MSDARVQMDPFLDAFGLPAIVTRPAPDNAPISTTGFWVRSLNEGQPFGTDFRRLAPRRVFVVPTSEVPHAAIGTIVRVAEELGGPLKNWLVGGYDDGTEADNLRLIVKQTT